MNPKSWKQLETISLVFVPLGFLYGVGQKSIPMAIASGGIWFVIYRLIKNKNIKNGDL